MKLSTLIDPHLVLIDADADSMDAAVELGLKAICGLYPHEVEYDDVMERLNERRKLGGTCFPSGISIPHARLPSFNDFIIAAIVPRRPIVSDETCLDQSCAEAPPIRIVWLILLSQVSSTVYLNTIAKLMEASKNEAIMARLVGAESPSQFISVIDDAGYLVKKSLVVTDIMSTSIVSVLDTATIKDVLDIIYTKKLHYVPVVDASGVLVGELGVLDLLKAGIPDYAFRIGSLKFLAELEPMTELLQHEDTILVRSIMQKPLPIAPSTSVVELAFEMARGKKRHYAVVEEGRLIGVVSYMDIVFKVLRA
ncbi:MAG: CBS domain-containing protein [Spirochaetia bacterium]|jgi:PTS system nitrogen regulatory IIA component|nr:CBS domain-containing protein [Spirochaetia bacterium]